MYLESVVSGCCWGLLVGECLHPCLGFKKKRTSHMKVYDEGYRRIMDGLDVTKLLKRVTEARAMIKMKFRKDPDFIKLPSHRKHVIFLDESPDSHDSGKEDITVG